MPGRKVPLVNNEIYHIYSRSIAGFRIFNQTLDNKRIIEELSFYSTIDPPCGFSVFKRLENADDLALVSMKLHTKKLVDILAYCIMPTHIHLILKQLVDDGISAFMQLILNSYSKYFNSKYKRKGPLWEGRFNNILIETDEQLLHLHRYVHLNPVTDFHVEDPKDWDFSSYKEYLGLIDSRKNICSFSKYFNMKPSTYEKFVLDRKDCQRQLAHIKHLILE